MQLLKLYSWHLAAFGIILHAFSIPGNQLENEDDYLNPDLDKPLVQYERTREPAFQPRVEVNKPAATDSAAGSGTPSIELTPNPLANFADATPTPEPAAAPSINPPVSSSPLPEPKPMLKKVPTPQTERETLSVPSRQQRSQPRRPQVDYKIYRDQSCYPIDPRKPNNPCTQVASCGCKKCKANLYGLRGRPYQPREPGGYACGKNCKNKRPQFSVYWPRPFSAKLDEHHPEKANARYSGCQKKRLIDAFDRLANFRLIDYQRTDNGYCGRESDPYGCFGESKVAGLGYRAPSIPNDPSGTVETIQR